MYYPCCKYEIENNFRNRKQSVFLELKQTIEAYVCFAHVDLRNISIHFTVRSRSRLFIHGILADIYMIKLKKLNSKRDTH